MNPTTTITLNVNGTDHRLEVEPRETLLEVLRERLDLTGAKSACDRGECGACAVLLGGQPFNACHLLAVQVRGRPVTTIEGLAARPDFAPLVEAMVAEDAGQCGYCIPGIAVAAYAALQRGGDINEWALRWELVGHICRCNAYQRIMGGLLRAAGR